MFRSKKYFRKSVFKEANLLEKGAQNKQCFRKKKSCLEEANLSKDKKQNKKTRKFREV